jgi:CRP/FNR family transcriptional regulator
MADPAELRRAFSVFRTIPLELLADVSSRRVERGAGEVFLEQGCAATTVLGVLTGRVRIDKRSPRGKQLCLDVLGDGEVIGAVAVVRRIPMPASATAIEPTACIEIPAADFERLMVAHPPLTSKVLDLICRRMVDAGTCRVCLATDPMEVRVAWALLRLATKFGGARGEELIFSQPVTRKQLAELAATTVESTIRVMSRWTREGWIRSQDSRITVLEPARLRELIEPPAEEDRAAQNLRANTHPIHGVGGLR